MGRKEEIIVGVLGQWASGKSTAAETLVEYLGGAEEVIFLTDRELLAARAVDHIRRHKKANVMYSVDEQGRQRFEGELATLFLGPQENLETVDLNTLHFDLHDEVYDRVPLDSCSWMDEVRTQLGHQIRDRSVEKKPIVIEAGFGTNTDPKGENPFSHTISELFRRLEEAGVEPGQVKWIIIEASYEKRAGRNKKRKDSVPAAEFDRFAADGGDLTPAKQDHWTAQGVQIVRIPNEHDDIDRFRLDIIAASNELFMDRSQASALKSSPEEGS